MFFKLLQKRVKAVKFTHFAYIYLLFYAETLQTLCFTLTQNAMNAIWIHLLSFVTSFAILKHLRAFVANWLMSQFTRFLRKILAPKTAVA